MADVDYQLRNSVHALRKDVDTVQRLTFQVINEVGVVNGQVAAVGAAQQQTRSELAHLTNEFTAFVLHAQRTANVQRAETRVGNLESKIEVEFGRYDKVRRTAAGLVRAFDSGLVKQESVEFATDLLMIESPRYWLAPAVVSLGAWSGGDNILCDQAIETAYGLAPARTALLFALILRRQNRLPSSVIWLRHYLRNLDPMALSREFAVVLESVAQGAFGAGGRQLIHESVDSWLAKLADDEDAHAAQVKRWRSEVESYRPDGAGASFQRLRDFSPQWPALQEALRGAETHKPFHDHYSALIAAEYHASERIEDSVDDILDILVDEFDTEELPLRRELAYEKAIIEFDGDLDRARDKADSNTAALGDTLDYLTVQTSAALHPSDIGVSPATQQVALASCVEWVDRAHSGFSRDYRAQYPADVTVEFPEQQPIGSSAFTVPHWSGSLTSAPMGQLEGSLARTWDYAAAKLLASMEFNLGRALIGPGVISAIILVVGVAINPAFGILAAGAWFGIAYRQANKRAAAAETLRDQVQQTIKGLKAKALEDLRGAGAEYTDYQTRYQAADREESRVRTLITAFAGLGQDKAPHEGRTLLAEGPEA